MWRARRSLTFDQLIRGLRENAANNATHDAAEPPIGLAAADTLLTRNRAAGLSVQMRVAGPPRPLGPGLDQAAYRILQQSLTNAARHGSGPAEERIAYGEQGVELTVSNLLSAEDNRDIVHGGHEVQGMRERGARPGGSLEVDRSGLALLRARWPALRGQRATTGGARHRSACCWSTMTT
jgi:signal transduction histidine kinase